MKGTVLFQNAAGRRRLTRGILPMVSAVLDVLKRITPRILNSGGRRFLG